MLYEFMCVYIPDHCRCEGCQLPSLFFLSLLDKIKVQRSQTVILLEISADTIQTMSGLSTADKSKPYIPLTGLAKDGWSTETEATATCFCGAVQLKVVSRFNTPIPLHIAYDLGETRNED